MKSKHLIRAKKLKNLAMKITIIDPITREKIISNEYLLPNDEKLIIELLQAHLVIRCNKCKRMLGSEYVSWW